MRKVLVTGMSGLGRSNLFENPAIAERIILHDLGEEMRQIARERGLPYSDSNILRASAPALAALRAAALERMFAAQRPGRGETRPVVVSAHGLFLLTDRIHEGLSSADVTAIRPDLIITLVDAPQRIHDRLREHSGEYFHLTIESIVRWQEFEVFFASHLARDRGVRHFVVPVTQPETFLALVSGAPRPLVYASYPMTHLSEEKKPLVREFVRKLEEKFIVFDPSAVEGASGHKAYYSPQDKRAILNHTIVRDLDWFIGINAQAVVAYWPQLVFSSGMNDELRYAYENGRETYLVAEVTEDGAIPSLSPFTTYKNKTFWSSRDFFDYMELDADLQRAFLVMQREMMDLLQAVRQHQAAPPAREDFRRKVGLALTNTMPDGWLAGRQADLDALADRIFERWAPMVGVGQKQ